MTRDEFLIIHSGGALIWKEATTINSLSLGVISVIGAVYCEKLEGLLKRMASVGLPSREG